MKLLVPNSPHLLSDTVSTFTIPKPILNIDTSSYFNRSIRGSSNMSPLPVLYT
jgi:hypothetical protein